MKKSIRQIRFNLMDKDNLQKYLKYAVGEILLVVIGILFALSINNWNENRKTQDGLIVRLQELKTELLADNERLNSFVIRLKKVDEYGQYLQDFTHDELENIDIIKLRKAIFNTGFLLTFEKNKTAYRNITISGDIKRISNIALKQDLANFYGDNSWGQTYHDDVIMESYYEYLSYIHKFTKPGVLRSFYKAAYDRKSDDEIQKAFTTKDTLVDWSSLKNDSKFKILLDKVQLSRFNQVVFYQKNYKKDAINILAMIENELEKSS